MNNYDGKRERMMRHYDSLKNFVGENKVFLGGDALYVSTANNGVYDTVLIADGVRSFNELWKGKQREGYAEAKSVSRLAALAGKDIKVESDEVVNAFTQDKPYYKNIVVKDVEVSKTVVLKATEGIELDGIILSGGKDGANGKVTYAAKELSLKNISAQEGSTLYNAFEGYQSTNDPNYQGIKKLVAENLDIDCPSLTHNVINVYTPAEGAEIVVRNSKFNLTVDNSNILRLANYLNVENVTVRFENVDWTYENGLSSNDWGWAGLAIYQPAVSDAALNGDNSKLKTWKFIIKNCRYNGTKVTENNFGQHNQALYLYNMNKSGIVSDPAGVEGLTIIFE